mgnify:CR=1 FL=1
MLLQRVCERLLQAHQDIRGIILFGSLAREEPHQDVDLMVVMGQEMERSERDRTLIALREALGPYAAQVDLVVAHEEGLWWGLEAHYPFYLDIAFDGVVLYDAGGIAARLEQARREVAARGIQRTETGGWQFPVPYRRRVPLSPYDNLTWASRWLDDAERDLQAARVLFQSALYERSVTHCQQAVEKSIKAVLACMGWMEPSHYLSALLRSLLTDIQDVVWQERLERMAQIAVEMEPAAVGNRYPVEAEERVIWPVERYGKAEAARALDLAGESLEIGQAFTHWWAEGSGDA